MTIDPYDGTVKIDINSTGAVTFMKEGEVTFQIELDVTGALRIRGVGHSILDKSKGLVKDYMSLLLKPQAGNRVTVDGAIRKFK